jgi:hypothetical protein
MALRSGSIPVFRRGGHVLPFCHRCTGVYLGIGVSGVFLLVSGYVDGLSAAKRLSGIAGLLMMPVFGFISRSSRSGDCGAALSLAATSPFWRCRHVIVVREGRVSGRHEASRIGCWLFLLLLNTLPVVQIQSSREYYVVLVTSLFGILCILLCIAAISILGRKIAIWLLLGESGNGYERASSNEPSQSGRGTGAALSCFLIYVLACVWSLLHGRRIPQDRHPRHRGGQGCSGQVCNLHI